MKQKTFKSGTFTCKSTLRQVGHGFEVCFTQGKKVLFVGTFTRSTEANVWFSHMNREVRKLGRRFSVGQKWPVTWFHHLVTSTLNKRFVAFQARFLVREARNATRVERRCVRQYRRLARRWEGTNRRPLLRAA